MGSKRKTPDEVEYDRYLAYCKVVGNDKPMEFERWNKRRFYSDHIFDPRGFNQRSSVDREIK